MRRLRKIEKGLALVTLSTLMVDYSCGAERSADQILRYLDGINTGIVKKEGP